MSPGRQGAVGVVFALSVIASWLALHLWGVFLHRWSRWDVLAAPLVVLAQTWLGAAMFIAAHDAIHGSLAPGRPRLNAALGQLGVGLYAGFSYRKLARTHAAHHATPGAAADPDFHAAAPHAFGPWLGAFILRHFGLRELASVALVLAAYLALGARPANLVVFWGLPATLSALQLFYFGTYRPHRPEAEPFADHHRARSLRQGRWWSVVSCLNFGGWHHEHHLHPHLPWWRLPEARVRSATTAADAAAG